MGIGQNWHVQKGGGHEFFGNPRRGGIKFLATREGGATVFLKTIFENHRVGGRPYT